VTSLSGMAAHVARRVERLKKEEPAEKLRERPLYARAARPLPEPVARGGRVAEVRFADPERGRLVPEGSATAQEAAARAAAAQKEGVQAVAIWVERNFHAGDWSHLEAARAACPGLFLIARDVVLDLWQIERARAAGADAIELNPEVLGPALNAAAAAVRAAGLTPLAFGPGLTVRTA
jgi:indole-3-glycerol phosphate synthase